jgi:hypothetical protein
VFDTAKGKYEVVQGMQRTADELVSAGTTICSVEVVASIELWLISDTVLRMTGSFSALTV